jgi:ketosteroid isomerase-like protein
MRASSVVAAAAIVSIVFVSCGPKEADLAGLKKAAEGYNAASKEALMGGDMSKPAAFFADDGMEMAPNMATAKGKDAIKAMWTQMMSSGVKFTSVEFTTLDLKADGSIGYEIGTYDMSISTPDMGDIKDKGKYISVWHQLPDGTWKLTADTWNSDMPMPAMEKPGGKKK